MISRPEVFSVFDYQRSGDSWWSVTSDESVSGHYSAQAGDIDHNESSTLKLTQECNTGQIGFQLKVSSESGYDELVFSIDGRPVENWSGEMEWTQVSFSVNAGTHTFEWAYEKDSSISDGEDTAWIDDVVFSAQ